MYTNQYIPQEKLFSKEIDIEHIIPKARLFDDSFSNKTLEYRQVNIDKSDETAFDFLSNAMGEKALNHFLERVEKLYKQGNISKAKYKKLLMKGSEIGEGFIERDLRESQYIAKKAKNMLLEICHTVTSTSGSITDKLREDWGLINVMKELNIEKYRVLGLTEFEERKDGQKIEQIIDWTKRNDHRHHAMDALTVAFTKYNHIQYLNNLNAKDDKYGKKDQVIVAIEQKETYKDEDQKRKFIAPMLSFRSEAKKHLESILISFKAKNKVVTRNQNRLKGSQINQITLTPRGQLHKETIYGKARDYETKEVKIGTTFNIELANQIANKSHREAVIKRLAENDNDPKKAFGGKNSQSKNPVITSNKTEVPEKVKLVWLKDNYTIRKDVSPELKIEKVIDVGVRKILQARLDDFGGNAKEAFSNLEQNPIWLNKAKGITIKRVTIFGINNAEALHTKKDHFGKPILNADGKKIPVDFVSTGNNHHVAIYRDEKGGLQEKVVSLFEAVERVNAGLPIIIRNPKSIWETLLNKPEGMFPQKLIENFPEENWEFVFTMKQNEMFVFPSEDFDPNEIDLMNPENYHLISPHLFRVQKFTTKDYFFRHHLETDVQDRGKLKGITWKREGLTGITGLIKVRINHIGQIIQIGEY